MSAYQYDDGVVNGYYMKSGETLIAQRFVKHGDADDNIAAVSAATDLAIGLLLSKTAREDQKVPVKEAGLAEAEAGGTVTRGQEVKIDSVGRVVNSAGAQNDVIVGNARQSATAAGEKILIHIKPARKIA